MTPPGLAVGLAVAFAAGMVARAGMRRRPQPRLRDPKQAGPVEIDYRGLFENAHDAIIVFDPAGETVLDVNGSACLLYGLTREEFVGRSMVGLSMHPERGAMYVRRTREAEGRFATFESRQLRKDGSGIDVEISAAEVMYQGRRAILSINRDVTARVQLESARQEMIAGLGAIATEWTQTFDAVQVPIVLLDVDGEIRRLNRAALGLVQRTFAQIIHSRAADIPHEPWQTIARVAAESFRREGTASARAVEGDAVWQVSSSIAGSGEHDRRAIVVAYDLTVVTRLEASLREAEVAAAMGALMTAVAHEVRNPLFTISALLDAWGARYGESEGMTRYAEPLRGQVDRLTRLMADLLEYGKPNPLQLRPVRPEEVIRAAAADCAAVAAQAGVELRLQLASDLPVMPLDPGRMEQAILNVIDNAIRHSPAGSRVLVDGAVEDERLVCRVTDEGCGVPAEDLERLFLPFFTRRAGGTGLGLAIAQRIVIAHCGNITFANREPAHGAVVTIRLPLRSDDVLEARAEAG